MAKLWRSLLGLAEARSGDQVVSVDDWYNMFKYQGNNYGLIGTSASPSTESVENSFIGYINSLYKTNGIVFACMQARASVFTEARFQYQKLRGGRPGDLFGTRDLALLENPWPNGTTGELLARAIQDVDLAGNHYVAREPDRLRRLRPDWVQIVLSAPPVDAVQSDVAGYVYWPGGIGNNADAARIYLPEEIAHWSPVPDPNAQYRGMSWLTPIIREIMSDKQATLHKEKFFANAATPNLSVSLKDTVTREQFMEFMEAMDAAHQGVDNAYKCLHPDTEVSMWDGTLRRADQVVPGDRVVAWSEGEAVPGTVSAVQWQPPSPIVTVTTQRGRVIRTNDRHPFLARRVVRRGRQYLSGEQWIDAAALRPGDLLTTGLGWASDGAVDSLTPYQGWVLGVMVGDGCTVSSTPVVSAWDEGIRDRLRIGHTLNPTGNGHDYRVLGVRALCVSAGMMGKRSWEKRIPPQVMTASSKVKSAFLSGLIDTDGHVTDPGTRRSAEVGVTSTSRALLADAQHLLASLGINSSLSLSMTCDKSPLRRHDAWRLHILGNAQALRLNGLLDLACGEKARRLSVYAAMPSKDDRSRYDRVASVEVGPAEPTIGIEVAGHHTHVTGGVVTHNTLYLGGGADVQVLGANMQQMDFKATQGAGETRIAAAARVHPVLVGLSEAMKGASLNAGNFAAARDSFGDGTMRPLWRSICAAYSVLVPSQSDARLWFDDRDIAFLRTDRAVLSKIQGEQATTINTYVTAGFEPPSARDAVMNNDLSLLVHTGLVSVQLVPPGTPAYPAPALPAPGDIPALPAGTSPPASPAGVMTPGPAAPQKGK